MLTDEQIRRFITQGYARVEHAFSSEIAAKCRDILWEETGCSPDDPSTWTKPVIWLQAYSAEPFVYAANAPALLTAFDQLVGEGRWKPMTGLGTFPVRFPTEEDTGDTGWHIDASFPGRDSSPENNLTWHVNIHSRGRALLMLFLFSDIASRMEAKDGSEGFDLEGTYTRIVTNRTIEYRMSDGTTTGFSR